MSVAPGSAQFPSSSAFSGELGLTQASIRWSIDPLSGAPLYPYNRIPCATIATGKAWTGILRHQIHIMLGSAPRADVMNVRSQSTVFISPILDRTEHRWNLSVDFVHHANSWEIIRRDWIRRQTHHATLCLRSIKSHGCLSCRTMKLRHLASDDRKLKPSRIRCA